MKAKDYQDELVLSLRSIFGEDMVKCEWDSVENDPHTSNHVDVYAPRHDISVGPFKEFATNLDCDSDNTKTMRKHRFTKYLCKDKKAAGLSIAQLWNRHSRCFLAIETEFSGSSKHIFGSIINASASGSIGIIIANKENYEKVNRMIGYLYRLEEYEVLKFNTLGNLFVFDSDEFLKLLSDFQLRNPAVQ